MVSNSENDALNKRLEVCVPTFRLLTSAMNEGHNTMKAPDLIHLGVACGIHAAATAARNSFLTHS